MRNDDPYIGKYGMTEIELNKVLEKNNFIKIRDRSSCGNLCEDEVRGLYGVYMLRSCFWQGVES